MKKTEQVEPQEVDLHKTKRQNWVIGILKSRVFFVIVVILLASLPAIYFYNHGQTTKIVGSLQTVEQVEKQVGKHYLLPVGESPTLATVTDVNRVKSQAFFVNSANGDKVLVYAKARKAILYRPSIDKIIEVAPLAIGNKQ